MNIRAAAVAGTWYPGKPGALSRDIDDYLAAAGAPPAGAVQALIVPHAGLMFSGPVGAHAYKAASAGDYDVAVIVGPSHFVAFDGVALWPDGAFDTPLGQARIDPAGAAAIAESTVVHIMPSPHKREHSLEMQLPFLRRVLPEVPIVPLLMGHQTRDTILALAAALATAFRGRRALLIASSDLSHYFDAETGDLDAQVQECVATFDTDRLLARFEEYAEEERGRYVGVRRRTDDFRHARRESARGPPGSRAEIRALGEISGDYSGVVGYLAAALGDFDAD